MSAYDRIHSRIQVFSEKDYRSVHCIDMHTAGEPLRVILAGIPDLPFESILEYRRRISQDHDHIRTTLMWEPRGHADMYGAILTPPEKSDSAFGAVFLHNDGYSTMCGHATIALAKLAVDQGWIDYRESVTMFKMDVPCGQLSCFVNVDHGKVRSSGFYNVPSFVAEMDAEVTLGDGSRITYDLAYGGAFYAFVDARQFGVPIKPKNTRFFIDKGLEIKNAVARSSNEIRHPFESELSFLYGTIFIEPSSKAGIHSRNVCMFANGEIDRSPTGSGVSARAAIHRAKGQLGLDEELIIESILGTTMSVTIDSEVEYGGFDAIIPKVEGQAYLTGKHTFLMDDEDPLKHGFLLK